MKRIRTATDLWTTAQLQSHPPRNPRRCFSNDTTAASIPRRAQWQTTSRTPPTLQISSKRKASTAAAIEPQHPATSPQPNPERFPLYAPSHLRAPHSAKLAALHARLSLPPKLPLQTLARCLVDPSADPRPTHNNSPFAVLGQDLLGYHTTEHLICHYPRLPMSVLFAAQFAFVGEQVLGEVRREWGVEVVAAPGREVDSGLLQLKREVPGNSLVDGGEGRQVKDMPGVRKLGGRLGGGRRNAEWNYRRGVSSRVVFDDEFGDLVSGEPYAGAPLSTPAAGEDGEAPPIPEVEAPLTQNDTNPTTVSAASATFVRALTGALYLHAGAAATKHFHAEHILSRQLSLHSMFNFTHPTRDLSRLCAREGFEPPVARLISETGRLSRTPVFVVGVYSGESLLGEAAGASLNEGRVRAAAAALRAWYLYSPPKGDLVLPSDVEGSAGKKAGWKAQMVDVGEIVT
ncbi:54S ribosomal protein L3 mitochondrial [Elasticomyces elasticus]|nr:54S ribosomal protein L3 mitochondrial [Elasticomyces elasticus]KAK4912744.1 54S ribosomal protein L3 mitochondrial [Elasticomyces elasticus]KAK5752182.1 54S ribosomal protein L3 mitochondrial [Elasticomyces elasticus]